MELYDNLVNTFGYDEPFFSSEITKKIKLRTSTLNVYLKRLYENKFIEKYQRGVYYIPNKTKGSKLSSKKVYEKKYINNQGDTFGYYVGLYFKNLLGLSAQVPNVIEIMTNEEKSRLRKVIIGNQKLRLRKSRCNINSKNYKILQLLELITSLDAKELTDSNVKKILKYMLEAKITINLISQYLKYFPDKTSRKLIESGIIYELASKQKTI